MTKDLKMSKSISLTAEKIQQIDQLAEETGDSFSGTIEKAIDDKISMRKLPPGIRRVVNSSEYWQSEQLKVLERIEQKLDKLTPKEE